MRDIGFDYGLIFANGLCMNPNAPKGRRVSTGAPVPKVRMQRYGLIAEIMISKNESGDLYMFIIQQESSAEVMRWGQELSLSRAMLAVDRYLESARPPRA
jgi:hypothetical protein